MAKCECELKPFKKRFIDPTQEVEVYRNLTVKKWSVRQDKVVAHGDIVILKNPQFIVGESGRQRVLKERTKNVHAWIKGELVTNCTKADFDHLDKFNAVYDPYKYKSFTLIPFFVPVHCADYVIMDINARNKVQVMWGGKV